jgi:hypothetical protein
MDIGFFATRIRVDGDDHGTASRAHSIMAASRKSLFLTRNASIYLALEMF